MNTSANRSTTEKRQPESIQHRVMKSVSEYNKQLNQERKEDRRVCMDLQTYTIHYPVGLGTDNKGLRYWTKRRRRSSPLFSGGRRYPVALLPTQYQDWFLHYSSNELKYFPLNTVTQGPLLNLDKLPPLLEMNLGNTSDSDMDGSDVLSDLDDDSSCSCGEEHCPPPRKSSQMGSNSSSNNSEAGVDSNSRTSRLAIYDENSLPPPPLHVYPGCNPNSHMSNSQLSFSGQNNNLNNSSLNGPQVTTANTISNTNSKAVQGNCKVCKQLVTSAQSENALICGDCGNISHPACLDIGGELLSAIRLYKWQCMDCKSCNQCGMPHDEDKMMFCDKCDRGYHTYCVGLTTIPEGHWVCSLCAICVNCNSRKASETSSTVQWQHALVKTTAPDGQTITRHQVFCETCSTLRKI